MSDITLVPVSAPASRSTNEWTDWVNSSDNRRYVRDSNNVDWLLGEYGYRARNLLINGGFDLAQNQAPATLTTYSNTSGRAHSADLWKITNENASVQYKRVDTLGSVESGLQAEYYGKFVKITNTGKMVISQVIEGRDCAHLRGHTVRLQAKMKYSVAASMVVRLGLLYLTTSGTVDSMPATFVSAFGAAGTDPTWGTNLTALAPVLVDGGTASGNGLSCTLTTSWVRYSATFTLPSDYKNLIPVIFTNGQPAALDELNISEVGLYDGQEIRDWMPVPFQHTVALAQRHLVKSFDLDTAPATNSGVLLGAVTLNTPINTSAANSELVQLPVTMRSAPSVTTYNPSAANANWRDSTGAADVTVGTVTNIGTRGFEIPTGAATTAAHVLQIHYLADASI